MKPEEKAAKGPALLKEAVLDYLILHPEGVKNSDIVHAFDLQSDQNGKQKNYLSWSILGVLMRDRTVEKRRGSYFMKQ